MTHLLNVLFGQGTWGAGGNLVAWVICGIPTILISLWHHRRQMRAELQRLYHHSGQPATPISRHDQPEKTADGNRD